MMGRRLRIRAPSRLHFGLLGWNSQAARPYGGIGLMIELPGIELVCEAAAQAEATGPLCARAQPLLTDLVRRLLDAGRPVTPARVQIVCAPEEHIGLGVGTQLSLAVAYAFLKLSGVPEPTPRDLAQLTGRGAHSGVGLHGFLHGGLIVAGGRKDETGGPPLLSRVPFPEEWSILIVQPPGPRGLHGADETQAFLDLPPIPQSVTDALCRLVLLEVLPALAERDLAGFGASLSALQAGVGARFAPAQGGIYAAPLLASIAQKLETLGFFGVGQSSWGPTLYGFTALSPSETLPLADRVRRDFALPASAVFVTKAANQGAQINEEA
jgi:beta-RFAP synthase